MERFFTDDLLQDYRIQIGQLEYTLMNHQQFYKWWREDTDSPALTRQVSFDIAMKTCTQLGEKYSMDAIKGVKFNNKYDILVAINEKVPSTTSEEKLQAISGFLITRLGECRSLPDIYSIHLICVNPGGISGKILIGAFLYCLKNGPYPKRGILELARGYTNVPAFFAYSKMGFDKDLTLYSKNCFTDLDVLPMSVNVDVLSDAEIIGYTKGTLKRVVHDDTRLFETGIPSTHQKEQIQTDMAILAQQYYLRQLAELYNEHGEFDEIQGSLIEIKTALDSLFRKYNCKSNCAISGGKRKTQRKKIIRYKNG
jgi:hypothetical protein